MMGDADQFDFQLPFHALFGQTHLLWCNSRSQADSDPLGPVSLLLDSARLNQTCVQFQG